MYGGEIRRDNIGYLDLSWNASTSSQGIRAYIIKLTLKEVYGKEIDIPSEMEYVYTGFDKSASTINYSIILPIGYKYNVKIASVDDSINQNISSYTDFGDIIVGSIVEPVITNDKILSIHNVSVLASDNGKSARYLGKLKLPNNAKIKAISVNITDITLNNSSNGQVRVWRDNAESDAVTITFNATGTGELETDTDMTGGWITVDAYDSGESGTSQAAFTADVYITYSELLYQL